MCHGLRYPESPRAPRPLPTGTRLPFRERLLCCSRGRPWHGRDPTEAKVSLQAHFPRAVYCLYLRLIHQPRQASSHRALPTAAPETSTSPVPVGAWGLQCPVLVSDLSSLRTPGLSGSKTRAVPSVLRGKGSAEPRQPALRSAVG